MVNFDSFSFGSMNHSERGISCLFTQPTPPGE